MKFETTNHQDSVSKVPMPNSADANLSMNSVPASANSSLTPKAGHHSIANGDRKTKTENS